MLSFIDLYGFFRCTCCFICIVVLFVYMSVHHMYVVPMKSRSRHQILLEIELLDAMNRYVGAANSTCALWKRALKPQDTS